MWLDSCGQYWLIELYDRVQFEYLLPNEVVYSKFSLVNDIYLRSYDFVLV